MKFKLWLYLYNYTRTVTTQFWARWSREIPWKSFRCWEHQKLGEKVRQWAVCKYSVNSSVLYSMIHHLYTALYIHHPKSSLFLSPYIWLPLPSSFSLHHPDPFLSGNHYNVVCLWVYLFWLFVCCFLFYVPHMREIIWFLSFSAWLTSPSMVLSRSIHVVANDNISLFLWLSSIVLYICTTSSLSNHLLKTFRLFPCFGYCESFCNEHRSTYIFMNKCF